MEPAPARPPVTAPPVPARTAGQPPTRERLRALERAENFPVALRLLPRELRTDLRAVYRVVRTIDELGDTAPGDRTALLAGFAEDLGEVYASRRPRSPVLAGLVPTVVRRGLPREPFDQLIEANLRDQRVTRYATFADLLDYCALSAAPVGRLVLVLLGAYTPDRVTLSDRMCAGLQVVEHLQDLAEDRRAGRLYLPLADLAAYGVRETALDATSASPALRRLVQFELGRVDALLDAGGPLLATLRGAGRLAVAGYLAGGRAAVDGVRRADGDVLGTTPGARRRDVARHLCGALLPGSTPKAAAC